MSSIQNREHFLNRVAEQLGRKRRTKAVKRPSWKKEPQWDVLTDYSLDELVEVLEKQCESIHTDFVRSNSERLPEDLLHMIQSYAGKKVITWDDSRFHSLGLGDPFSTLCKKKDISLASWDVEDGEESIRIAEQADVGITFSDITLAESGTVVLFSDQGKGRSVSLLPKTYIAIIPKSTIVPRMSQATREIHHRIQNGEQVASCVNFITGPSNSADIEMNLVVGVHGPFKAGYILVDDC